MLVRPWNRCLLELPDPADDTQSVEDWSDHSSLSHDSLDEFSGDNEPDATKSYSRALRLIVRLGQPFRAFLLARQHGGEYKRIASTRDIIAKVKDVTYF
ncbi:hypothetical protein EDB19DRAFT_1698553 [Suillus lakei]|nr:hypothetical protein EDB19DRAFT_1698553 [Suillus lakei]